MHIEAYQAVGRMVEKSGFDFGNPGAWNGLDIGGRDVNGTARAWFPHTRWQGLDIRSGPGVNIVADATTWKPKSRAWDFALSTECLEHVENWRGIVRAAASAVFRDGLVFFTAASTGRGAHGASGEHTPPEGEWYGNVDPEDLELCLSHWFEEVHVDYNPNPGDVYAWARRVL